MKNNYSKDIQEVLKYAKQEALISKNRYVELEHLLLALVYNTNSKSTEILMTIG